MQKKIHLPECDCDLVLVFPSGKEVQLEHRPSDSDDEYEGSFAVILPNNIDVVTYKGDNREPSSTAFPGQEHFRTCKQIYFEIPS